MHYIYSNHAEIPRNYFKRLMNPWCIIAWKILLEFPLYQIAVLSSNFES